MSVEAALAVDGWMEKPELEWLAARASGLSLVVEFGSWFGRSSLALASAKRLLCVDTWNGSKEHARFLDSGSKPFYEWWRNLYDYSNVTPFPMDLGDVESVELLAAIVTDRGGADMVFVDACHDYESVSRDIKTARGILKPGGLLCGHDYCDGWPDVRRAVDEAGRADVAVGSIWVLR